MSDVEEMGKKGVSSTAEAAATYGTLPFGGAEKGAVTVAKSLGAKVLGHALTGAAFGGGYGVVKGGLEAGAKAAAEGQGAGQIMGAMTHGAIHDGLVNAAAGAVLGGVVGGAIEGGTQLLTGKAAAQAAAQASATKAAAVAQFQKSFHPSFIGERFRADLAQAATDKLPDAQLATNILTKLLNTTTEQLDPDLVAVMVKKIGQFRDMEKVATNGIGASMYPEVDLPAGGAGPRVPLSPDLEPAGGAAPEQTPPAVAEPTAGSPLAQPVAGTYPVGYQPQNPSAQMEGLEGPSTGLTGPSTTITPTGVSPEEQNAMIPPAPAMTQPGALSGPGQAAESAPTQPTGALEPNRKALEPTGPVTPAPGGLRMQMNELGGPTLSKPKIEPTFSGTEASFAMNSLGKTTGQPGYQSIGNVAYRTEPMIYDKGVELNYLENLGEEKGAGGAVLKKLTKVADDHQVPMTVNALPLPRGNGKGRIPIDKLTEFYEKHGFNVVDSGEGWAKLRREPTNPNAITPTAIANFKEMGEGIPDRVKGLTDDRAQMAAGNVTEGKPMIAGKSTLADSIDSQLAAMSKAAEARLKAKMGKLNVGFDPSMISDAVIVGASKMYTMGLRASRLWGAEMQRIYGEEIKPHLDTIRDKANKFLMRSLGENVSVGKQMHGLLRLSEEGRTGMDWYNKTGPWLRKTFGEDHEMVARFIAATSTAKATDANATLALKAYGQWKLGLPFDGYDKNIQQSLTKATRGEVFGNGKVQGYLGALLGDPKAVAFDRWWMRAIGFKEAGNATGKSALTSRQYDLFKYITEDLAAQKDMTPREFQAAVWTGGKQRKIMQLEKRGEVSTTTGSFRPMEDLLSQRLGGLTPADWVEKNRVRLGQLRSISDGIIQARNGGATYSFDPYDYTAYDKTGKPTTMAKIEVPTKELTSVDVRDFRSKFSSIVERYPNVHLTLDPVGDKTAIKLNVMLPEGLNGGQFDYSTPAPESDVRGAWWARESDRVDNMLGRLGAPSRDAQQTDLFPVTPTQGPLHLPPQLLDQMAQRPEMAMSLAGESLGKSPEEMKALVDAGHFKPMSQAGLVGAVKVGKDGICWEYTDPVAPSYNTMKVLGSLRGKNMVQTLDKLGGREIISGSDIVQQYKNQAGFVRLSAPAPSPDAETGKVFTKMMNTGGQVVPASALDSDSPHMKGFMNSFWLFPSGRVVRSTYTHVGHTMAMKIPPIGGYAGDGAGGRIQRLLNMGIVRVQGGGKVIAFDATAQLTDAQRAIIKRASEGKDWWAGQITDEKGKLVSHFSSNSDKIHHFLAATNQ
jgi:hypothetical protein